MDLRKVGVIAGAFDPIHVGHLKFIDDSIEKYGLDKIFVLVEEKSKHKKSFADFAHRKTIVELSIKDNPNVEIYPAKTPSFPISSTLPELKSRYDAEFYLLVGNDVEEHIKTWDSSSELFENVRLIVTDRNAVEGHKRVSSGKVREQIKSDVHKVDMDPSALSYCLQHNLYK